MTDLPSRYVHHLKVHLMNLLGVSLAVFLATGAMAQISGAEDCKKYLSDLRWALMEPNSTGQIASDHAGAVLVGKTCDPEFIKSWFSTAGWTLKSRLAYEGANTGPFGPTDRRFYADDVLILCLPRGWLWWWFTGGCSAIVNVYMFQGNITNIGAHRPI
jgi:hypothetical protein